MASTSTRTSLAADASSSSTQGQALQSIMTQGSSRRATTATHESIVVYTSVVSTNGVSSTLLTLTSIPQPAATYGAEPITSAPAKPKSKPLGHILGPAIGAPVAVLVIAAIAFFFWSRSNRKKKAYQSRRRSKGKTVAKRQPSKPEMSTETP